MTMIRIQTGIDPTTLLPQFAYAHPFLAGARKREILVPTTLTTSKTKRQVAGFRAIHR